MTDPVVEPRPDPPWIRRQYDKRQSCRCGHRFGVHASGGNACLAMVDDGNSTALVACPCPEWWPEKPRLRRTLR